MVRANTRNYTGEVSRINSKQLKTLISNPAQYEITSGNKKIMVGVKGDNIAYQLANDKIVIGRLDKTALSYGWRYWFICPHCHSRRSVLYFTHKDIACRDCLNLHYASQSENKLDRLRRKIVKTRYTLFKGKDREYHNLFNHAYHFTKPKGMSRKRFAMEQNKLVNIESVYWDHARAYVDKICGKAER